MRPLVSCIMPTWNRRAWVPLALRCFLEQDYPTRELVVIDDGPDPVGDLVAGPGDPRIRYVHLHGRSSIGAKLNYGVRIARGDLLALWADDDWHGPGRLTYQVGELLAAGHGAQICGCDSIRYWDTRADALWRYEYVAGRRTNAYVTGGTMLFRREFWNERPFDDLPAGGEDNRFVRGRQPLLGTLNNSFYLATMHGANYSPKLADVLASSDNWTREAGRAEALAARWWVDGVRGIALPHPNPLPLGEDTGELAEVSI